ncbi:MAG TPA: glycoside hydrolase domain-containing protein [Longimicrobiaceae bacterium]
MSLLQGSVRPAVSGAKGFDVNVPVTASVAQAFVEHGYAFCVRYVGRRTMASHDLTAAEAETVLASGLALMVVQHVEEPGWHPTAALGDEYGTNAAAFAGQIGVPPGVSVWLDLECVADGTQAADATAYCNAWHDRVAAAGYAPGVYVGYQPGLTGQQLYSSLRFQHYWAAYNVDVSIPGRGWQLRQSVGSGTVGGITTEDYDDDVAATDAKGGTALWLVRN